MENKAFERPGVEPEASSSPFPWKTKHLVNLEFSGYLRVSRDPSDSLENKAFGDPGTPKGPARDLQGPPGTPRDPMDSLENKAFGDPGTPEGPARDLQGPLGIPPGPQGTLWIHWKKHLVILGLLRDLPGTSRDLQGP